MFRTSEIGCDSWVQRNFTGTKIVEPNNFPLDKSI